MATRDRTALISQLETLLGDLRSPVPRAAGADHDALQRAGEVLAAALVAGQIEAPAPERAANRTAIGSSTAATAAIAAAVDHALEHVEPGHAESPGLALRRELPVVSSALPGSMPAWAAGRGAAASHGPFVDRLGREVWIDVFARLRTVALVRPGETRPFLVLEQVALRHHGSGVELGACSLWFPSGLLAGGVPASGYTGLRVAGGTLTLSSPVALTGASIVIPAGVDVTLALRFAPPTATAGSGPGADARNLTVATPLHATLVFHAAGVHLHDLGDARLELYGEAVGLAPTGRAASYDAGLARIAIPYHAAPSSLKVASAASTLIAPAGRAPITAAAWSLPVTAVTDPSTLGAASGAGGLALHVGPGLTATWAEHDQPAALGASVLLAEPGMLTWIAAAARASSPAQRIALWDEAGTRGTLELTDRPSFPWRYVASAAGREVVSWEARVRAQLDRPVTAAGARLPLVSSNSLAALIQQAAGTSLLIEGLADPVPPTRNAFVLANAVLETGPAVVFALFGPLLGGRMASGIAAIELQLGYLIPTLPDPYVTNLDLGRAARASLSSEPGAVAPATGLLVIEVAWHPGGPPALGFELSAGSDLGPLAPTRAPAGSDAPLLISAPQSFAAAVQAGPDDAANLAALAKLFTGGRGGVALLDVSSNASQLGVAVVSRERRTLAVTEMYVARPGSDVRVITLPEVQWEPVVTRDGPAFPTPVTFADCGGATELATQSVELVRVAPRPALDFLISGYQAQTSPRPIDVRLTLPFGIAAVAKLRRSLDPATPGPEVGYVAPEFPDRGLTGGAQISIQAPPVPSSTGAVSPGLPGASIQLRNALHLGAATGKSVLTPIDVTFNGNFGPGRPGACVPVERIDLSGYGESLFSNWRNPTDAAAIVSKVQLDVIRGRTSLEVVQAYSVLYPWAQRVVRTITIERENGATMVRHDSGWQALGDGVFAYPSPGLTTHPGVVHGVRNVVNIRDTGQTYTTSDGSLLMAVRFDCDVQLEGVIRGGAAAGVPSRGQLGFVQLTDPTSRGVLAETSLAELIAAFPTLGGPLDCMIDIRGSGQHMRVTRVGIGTAAGLGVPQFAMAAYGSPSLPGGGEWSFVRQRTDDETTGPVDPDLGVPLIRRGAASAVPPASSPYRFADPADLLAAAPAYDYGILHASGTQRLLFARPKIDATGASAITSARPILFADPYAMATALSAFPHSAVAVTIPDPAWRLDIVAPDHYRLHLAQPAYTLAVERTLIDAPTVRSVVRYHDENGVPSTVRIAIDTAAAVPWSFHVSNVQLANHSDLFGEVMGLVSDLHAEAGSPAGLDNARTVFGPALQPIMDALALISRFGQSSPPHDVRMTNDWKLEAGLKIPAVKGFTDAMKAAIPILDDLDIKVVQTVTASPPSSEAAFEVEIACSIPVSGPFVIVILARMQVKIVAGAAPAAYSGTTVLFQLGIGCGLKGKIGPFEVLGFAAVTAIFVTGDVTGIGWSLLSKVQIDLEVVEIEVTIEGASVHLSHTCGSGAALQTTDWSVTQCTVAVEVTIFWIIDIDFEYQSTSFSVTNLSNPLLAACDFPDVL